MSYVIQKAGKSEVEYFVGIKNDSVEYSSDFSEARVFTDKDELRDTEDEILRYSESCPFLTVKECDF